MSAIPAVIDTRRHPGDVLFADLPVEHQQRIAKGWGEDRLSASQKFNGLRSDADRWHVLSASGPSDSSYEAEVARIDRGSDPATVKAHAQLVARERPFTELGMARRLVAAHGDAIRYVPQLGYWLVWDGRRWAEDLTGEVVRKAEAVVDESYGEAFRDLERRQDLIRAWQRFQTDAKLRAIVSLTSTKPGIPVTADQLDADPWALNVENGIVDLRTGQLRPHDPGSLFSKLVPARFDPDAACPTWERFLREIFDGNNELIGFVQRIAGYSMTGNVKEQMLIFAYGTGANGKSSLLDVLRTLAGDYGVNSTPAILTASYHQQHPTGLTDFRGARMATTSGSRRARSWPNHWLRR